MANLEKLTIIIPTYKRQNFLSRQVSVWKGTSAKVIILDGSETSWLTSYKKELPANFEYYHMPETIENRLSFAKERVLTPYAVLLSDDELYIPSALQKCIEELDRDPDLVACKGVAIGFNFIHNTVAGYQVYDSLRHYKIDQDTPQGRINAHMSDYSMATLWSVTKADVFKSMLDAMKYGPFLSAAAIEMQCTLIGAWCGKIKVVDELMWLRSFENRNIWWEFGNNPFHEWYTNPDYAEDIEKFITSIVQSVKVSDNDSAGIRRSVIEGIEKYVGSVKSKKPGKKILSRSFSIRKLFPANLKSGIKKKYVAVYQKIFNKSFDETLEQAAKHLESKGVKVDFDQLIGMSRTVKEFHLSEA